MTQQSGSQFDDDLTVGMDDSESFSTGSIDLFEFGGDEESPIARLQTIILSIDWEINDDILQQLDDELVDLAEIWADDKIKQVYIQGLNKIGKYINKERAGAHPNAIKLLITFYHNLEKIVSSDDAMTEKEKKQLLLADVKKFDQLKSQISQSPEAAPAGPAAGETAADTAEDVGELKALKAIVLGIDWEIKDNDLDNLSNEVHRLETTFSHSKGKLILLQGIGALGSYINKNRSQSNRNAFTLLHSFYETLEKITGTELSAADKKRLLLAEVANFNGFKAEIAEEKEAPAQVVSDAGSAIDQGEPSPVTDTEEAESEDTSDIDSHLDSVFGDTSAEAPSFAEDDSALEGVNVETEADDESDEDGLPFQDGGVAPALAAFSGESSYGEDESTDDLDKTSEPEEEKLTGATAYGEDLFGSEDEEEGKVAKVIIVEKAEAGEVKKVIVAEEKEEEKIAPAFADVPDETDSSEERPAAELPASPGAAEEDEDTEPGVVVPLPGVDVESEADDDLDEEALPVEEGELAPALSGAFDDQESDGEQGESEDDESTTADLEDRLGDFFDDEVEASTEEWGTEKKTTAESAEEEEKSVAPEEISAALAEEDEEKIAKEEPAAALSFLDDESLGDKEEDVVEPAEHGEEAAAEILLEEEDAQAVTEEALSFMDEEEGDTAPEAISDEEITESVESGAEGEESDFDDEIALTASEEESPAEEAVVEEEVVSEEELSAEEAVIEEEVVAEDLEDQDSTDTIEFSVPGEDAVFTDSEGAEEVAAEADAVIEFNVPGEETVAAAASFLGEAAEEEGIQFETVEDDVAIDPLPGEEYVDESDSKVFAGEDEKNKYTTIAANIGTLRQNVTIDSIQDVFREVNRLRSSESSNYTEKIFLQLLSTVCQHLDTKGGESASANLALLDDIFAGLEMSSGNIDQAQRQLLACVSQVLLLQQEEVARDEGSVDAHRKATPSDLEDKGLNSFVQQELAEIRQLFIDEIGSLREEISKK